MEQGGVVFRVAGELAFLPASIAMKVMPTPETARVPGAPIELRGVALVDGSMIPVIDLGDPVSSPLPPISSRSRELGTLASGMVGAMLVCVVLGEPVGLVGIEILETGRFEVVSVAAPRAPGEQAAVTVRYGTETARSFDVTGAIASVREGRWAV
jgi:chemotaxis signal transduction protein